MTLTTALRDQQDIQWECEQFMYSEAALLDDWRLDEWLGLFAEDAVYIVPSTDLADGDPDLDLALINDDRSRLAGRVQRLKSTWAHIENPHSRTVHQISNVRIADGADGMIGVHALFSVYRARPHGTSVYAGSYAYRLRRHEDGLLIVRKTATLVHRSLRDSGGVLSILL